MKRALLIAGGTVGGLGAVLAITPPQFTSTQDVSGLSGSLGVGTASAQPTAQATSTAPKPAATKATPTKKATAGATASPTATHSSATQIATPSATPTVATPSGGYSGTVTGASFNARNYGTLAATVTFSNGKITNVSASQSPRSWSENSLSALLPFVIGGKVTLEQVKQYSAASLPCGTSNSCKSQASYTADAFWSSVKSAINKAGL
ncbi:hypothetical protein [Candidatus Planktophila dulcis]|uniref:hypothetical protein n=1 Tax=Candidatus Planktophila dulcis TaxID=1884914 RepID=UPI003BEEB2D7